MHVRYTYYLHFSYSVVNNATKVLNISDINERILDISRKPIYK